LKLDRDNFNLFYTCRLQISNYFHLLLLNNTCSIRLFMLHKLLSKYSNQLSLFSELFLQLSCPCLILTAISSLYELIYNFFSSSSQQPHSFCFCF
jgi:hypothetical protein